MSKKNRTFATDYSYCLSAADESATSLRHVQTHVGSKKAKLAPCCTRQMHKPLSAEPEKRKGGSASISRRHHTSGVCHFNYLLLCVIYQ